jgi:hypothetical protein
VGLPLLLVVSPLVTVEERQHLVDPAHLWDAAWPVAAGILLAVAGVRLQRRFPRTRVELPPGDLLALLVVLWRSLERSLRAAQRAWTRALPGSARTAEQLERLPPLLWRLADGAEQRVGTFELIGLLFVLLGLVALLGSLTLS